MLELWGMRSTPSLPLLPGPLRPGVVAPNKDPIYIELTAYLCKTGLFELALLDLTE